MDPPPHPHPYFAALFKTSREVPDHFGVKDFALQCEVCLAWEAKTCGACKSVRYCSRDCQRQDWERHRPACKKAAAALKKKKALAKSPKKKSFSKKARAARKAKAQAKKTAAKKAAAENA